MTYTIVTEKRYIPYNKNGGCNFIVLKSDSVATENKHVYVIINQVASIEFSSSRDEMYIYVVGRTGYLTLHVNQREMVFDAINKYYEDSENSSSGGSSNHET